MRITGTTRTIVELLILQFALVSAGMGADSQRRATQTLFPLQLPGRQWLSFPAEGFGNEPACGVLHRKDDCVSCGVPLGGIDTGCIDLETSGLWGYCTIFNTLVPRRGPVNLPILGLSVAAKTWVLCDPGKTKRYEPPRGEAWSHPPLPKGFPVTTDSLMLEGVTTAKEIHYWGHYPVADIEFETDAPVSVGLRAWSPFLPGDIQGSVVPGAVFEVYLRNLTDSSQQGTIAFSFPGPTADEAGSKQFSRQDVQGDFTGIVVDAPLASYALGVAGKERLRAGGELGAQGRAWSRMADGLPEAKEDQPGSSVAVDFSLPPGGTKVVRFVLAWCAPTWSGAGYNWGEGKRFTHTYVKYYPSAECTASMLARDCQSLLKRVLAWQQVIYSDSALPVWLRDSLVNVLYALAEDSLWPQAGPPLPEWVRTEDGLFGLNESPRDCPDMECLPCTIFGQFPLVYFFQHLALANLRGYLGYQDHEGAPPFIFGGMVGGTPPADFTHPTRGYQVTCNPTNYVVIAYRYWQLTGDKAFLREFYPSLKKATEFMIDLNRGPDGIISMPDRKVDASPQGINTEWYEWYAWQGMVAHVGGLHLATLRMAQDLAEQVGDEPFAERCRDLLKAGTSSMETKMWNGDYYLSLWDTEKDRKNPNHVHAFQLDGEWLARSAGLQGVFRPDRVKRTLGTIKRVCLTPYGAVDFACADGSPIKAKEWPMIGYTEPNHSYTIAVLMLAMNYMYAGEHETGLELAERFWKSIVCTGGMAWNMPAETNAATGKRFGGSDYYHNMLLWALPAALEGKPADAPSQPGGLVDRVLNAAAK